MIIVLNELDRVFFGPRYINITTNQFVPNMDREKGFLRFYGIRGIITQQGWQQYKIELNGTFTKLTNGIVPIYWIP